MTDPPADGTSPAELRRIVYRVLATLFLYPTRDRLATLATAAPELRRCSEPLRDLVFFPSWSTLLTTLEAISEADAPGIQGEYTGLFVASGSCPPYESAHSGRPGLDTGLIAAQVQAVYGSLGMTMAAPGEPPDHLPVELEFMSFLCAEETRSEETGEAGGWIDHERAFLSGQLLRWLPRFTALLRREAHGSFYRRVAEAALEFAQHDRMLLDAMAGVSP